MTLLTFPPNRSLIYHNTTTTTTTAVKSIATTTSVVIETAIGPVVGFVTDEFTQTVFILMGLILVTMLFRIGLANLTTNGDHDDNISSIKDIGSGISGISTGSNGGGSMTVRNQKKIQLGKYIPESALTIVLGVMIGGVIRIAQHIYGIGKFNLLLSFNDHIFFLILIPPLILESGYFLNRSFFRRHIVLILLYAVVGTLLNSIAVGLTLYVVGFTGWYNFSYSLLDCLLFGSLISAVDPVAVLAVFDDIGVNEMLYMLVFGESVLNDAVSIVLYNLFVSLSKIKDLHFTFSHLLLAIVKLFYVSIGGIAVGISFGFMGSVLSRFTSPTPLLEPLIVLLFAFTSYFVAESVLMSGIMAILFCATFMNRYVELNICKKSHITLKYGLKLIASIAETLVFTYLGISIVLHQHLLDIWFTVSTLVFILAYRFVFTFAISVVYNTIRRWKCKEVVSWREQLVLSYSGLRGIVFALAFIIPVMDPTYQDKKDAIITTTMIASCFSIFVQGSTIRPMMSLLSIRQDLKTSKQVSEGLQAEGWSLRMEEREVTDALKHVIYLETTMHSMPPNNPERQEFREVNEIVEEKILWRLLDEIEALNNDITQFNQGYINTEAMSDLLEKKKDVCEDIQKMWRRHIKQIGLDKAPDASSEILFTFGKLRESIYMKMDNINPRDQEEGTVTEARFESPGVVRSDFGEQVQLFDILETHGVLQRQHHSNKYHLSEWASDEKFLSFLQRILQEENIRYWIDEANDFLETRQFHMVKSLLRVLRFEIQRQQEIRSAEILHLKQIDFAYKVFSIGIDHAMDAVQFIAGQKLPAWKRADNLMQKICLRRLKAEEASLVKALESMTKFEIAYASMNTPEQEGLQQFRKDIEEQEKAIRVIQEASYNPNVNFQRILNDTDSTIFNASNEFTSLLELEHHQIDNKEFEKRIRKDPDFPSLLKNTGTVDKSIVGHRIDDEDELWAAKLRRASIEYERELTEYEELMSPRQSMPGTPTHGSVPPSPSIFSRAVIARRLSDTFSPHTMPLPRSNSSSRRASTSDVLSPMIRRRHNMKPFQIRARQAIPHLQDVTIPVRSAPTTPLGEFSRNFSPLQLLSSFKFPVSDISFKDIPSHDNIRLDDDDVERLSVGRDEDRDIQSDDSMDRSGDHRLDPTTGSSRISTVPTILIDIPNDQDILMEEEDETRKLL